MGAGFGGVGVFRVLPAAAGGSGKGLAQVVGIVAAGQ